MLSAVHACLLTLIVGIGISSLSAAEKTYRAAVLEHSPIKKKTHQETYDANLKAYRGNASVAASKGADIIVFPEYGIGQMGIEETREELTTLAQAVPDPEQTTWVPCIEQGHIPHPNNIKLLVTLSCIARKHNIAVVANLISRVACNSTIDQTCPSDDQFLYNTNVIFAKNGTLVGRYWKHHLFREDNLNPAPKDGYTIVDLEFAQFGTVVCFDLMFSDPLLDYVTKHGIKNILFPTNWVDLLPISLSIQTFSSTAHALGINILAANLHNPMEGSIGSGIYSGAQGPVAEVYDLATPFKLLIADIPVNPPAVPEVPNTGCLSWVKGHVCADFDPWTANTIVDGENIFLFEKLPTSAPTTDSHLIWYVPLVNTVYVYLEEDDGTVNLCQDGTCCQVKYEFANRDRDIHYALSGVSGYISSEFPVFMQVCTLVRCETRNISTCGKVIEGDTTTRFNVLELSGDFNTEYLYPNVLSDKMENIKPDQWKFTNAQSCPEKPCKRNTGTISVNSFTDDAIMVARIIGRVYDRDFPDNSTSHNISPTLTRFSFGTLFAIFLAIIVF